MMVGIIKSVAKPSNENKTTDGWRESASLWMKGEISWRVRSQSCQPFAPSHGQAEPRNYFRTTVKSFLHNNLL